MKKTNTMQQKNRGLRNTSLRIAMTGLFLCGLFISGCRKNNPPPFPGKGSKENVKHVVVIYMENHSFDNLYGQFAGANGLANATTANTTQVNGTGTVYTTLPSIVGSPNSSLFPTSLANTYFNIDQYVPNDLITPDVTHRFYQEPLQIDGGKM